MAFTSGIVSSFFNKVITSTEVLAIGDGIETSFLLQLLNPTIFVNSLTVKYTIGSVEYTVTSNSSGVLIGDYITYGSVNEGGSISIQFSTPPDDLSEIKATEYKLKGIVRKLLDFVVGAKYTQNVGTGDGSQKIFNTTISNTPISKGQALLYLKISTYEYYLWDNGDGTFENDEIDSENTTLNYETGALHLELKHALDNGIASTLTYISGESGRDWFVDIVRQTRNNSNVNILTQFDLIECKLKNAGESGKESVYTMFREYCDDSLSFGAINLAVDAGMTYPQDTYWWCFAMNSRYAYEANGYKEIPHINTKDGPMSYWFMSNKNRIMGGIKVTNSIDETFYIGLGFRFSSPAYFRYPLFCAGTCGQNIRYWDTTNHNFLANGGHYQIVYNIDATVLGLSAHRVHPRETYNYNFSLWGTKYNDKKMLMPIYIESSTPKYLLMKLDGVFWLHDPTVSSGDTITVDGKEYVVFQNTFQTGELNYLAMRKD